MKHLILGNTIPDYIWLGVWIVGALLLKRQLARLIINLLAKIFKRHLQGLTVRKFREILNSALGNLIFIIALYIAVIPINFPESWDWVVTENFNFKTLLSFLYSLILGYCIILVVLKIVDCISLVILKKYEIKEGRSSVVQVIPFATDFTKIILVVIGILIILSTLFHINVGALIAGLGIGGLAIAMAAKETLENLLGSFIIFMDKPFVVGDFVYLNNTYCTVDKVGMRSTRFRTIDRTYLTLPNRVVIGNAIQNYTLRDMRRADRTVQLSRKTTHSQITNIIKEVKTYLAQNERTGDISNTYVNFHNINISSLDIRMQYYVTVDDWEIYLEVVEEVNLKLLEIIENNHTELAYNTQLQYNIIDDKKN